MGYNEQRLAFINAGRPLPEKKKYRLRNVSPARQKKLDEQKEQRGEKPTEKQKWFDDRHKEMVGVCQCGCGGKSSKGTITFRNSAAHIFPQRLFKSIQFHPLNWVERSFWNGCHRRMDEKSMAQWKNFADWDDIVAKFLVLEKLLTPEERGKKFFRMLEEMVRSDQQVGQQL